MKVCLTLDSNLKLPGGVQTYVRGLHDSLRARGHDVTILTSSKPAEQDKKRQILSLGRSIDLPLSFSVSVPIILKNPFLIDQIFEKERYDIVHIPGHGGLLSWWVMVRIDRPVVATFLSYHSSLVHRSAVGLFRPLTDIINSRLAARIGISHAAVEYSRLLYPGDYTVIPPGVNRERYYPASRSFEESNLVTILFVGRLDPRKGLLHLVKAVSKFSVDNWRLVVVGDGPRRAKAERVIEAEGLGDKVTFAGRVPDAELPDYYRSADIYCSPAIMEESFGIVLIEAMASGLPVVAYANRGYREVLDGELKECLVDVGDSNMLSNKLEQLIQASSERKRLGDLSLKRVERYEWNRVAQEIEAVYQEVVK